MNPSSKNKKPLLQLAWCSAPATKYATLHWHYSKNAPSQKCMRLGVWEAGEFIGCVIFGWGANRHIGSPYGLQLTQVCELTRVALARKHQTPVSRILSIGLKMLKGKCPGLRLVVSYADTAQGHHGGIYQAGNWVYAGPAHNGSTLVVKGQALHSRTVTSTYGHCSLERLLKEVDPKAYRLPSVVKHRYLMPLDAEMKQQISKLSRPYPRPSVSINAEAAPERAAEA